MSGPLRSLRASGLLFIGAAFLAGVCAAWLWAASAYGWRGHQDAAYAAGLSLHHALQNNTPPPPGITLHPLSPKDQAAAASGAFRQISGAPPGARLTIIPVSADGLTRRGSAPLTFAVLSPDLLYPLSRLPGRGSQSAAEITGQVSRLLASYCSDPFVVAQTGTAAWVRIEAQGIWGCTAAPPDRRLLAVLLAVIALAALVTAALDLSADFSRFAAQLRDRRRVGGPESYAIAGPRELQEIVGAVNSYLETERAQLEGRAAVLSGVSHDLGTPATRLRLRAALIPDDGLRRKLEADIDSMTGIIESVLTYTRAEMGAEAPRKLSLDALVDAIVADYQDMGAAVTFRRQEPVIVPGARSVFMSRRGQGVIAGARQITVTGRPVALQRAITNLIDNALKYGRRATVALVADATTAAIIVEDEGTGSSAKDIEALLAPFRRGRNTTTVDGYGLGLTIVATIATLHGGTLSFEDTATGVSARLTIQRG
ncbi:sensor histidine kinase [Cribrihabitans pelagius]|uniref:sensor histidine kinase n=1 Tax=Cribrihabitans pelagius TaxID=1765746 RepID=UPI003B5968E2